jgi:uncharacterized membrane protein YkvA (DUF1232 family)
MSVMGTSTGVLTLLQRARNWARTLKRDVVAIWIAARDPRVPWYAKAVAVVVAAYALSPIDLIPDFIPVLGYLDDVLIVPAGIWLTVRLIPAELMVEFRAEAIRRDGHARTRRHGVDDADQCLLMGVPAKSVPQTRWQREHEW